MSFPDYVNESKLNETRSRVGCYVKSNISYVRRIDLEGKNSHLIILDIKTKVIKESLTFNALSTPRIT
jgi:hypothetical protein